MIWKCEADGDVVYVEATSEIEAYRVITEKLGPIPRSMIHFSMVNALPEGEELL